MADGLLNKASIILTPTGYKAGTLYNVAPVVEPYEDFDFARASVASRVNSSGLVEMVGRTLSSELMPSVATIVNLLGGSITQISSNSYSSTSDGTTGSSLRPKFDFNTTSGKTYKLVITPTGAITGTINFDFYDGSSYLFQNYDFTTTKEIYFTDNGSVFGGFDGTKTYSIASFTISVKEVIDTNNIPRISYDSNGANGHILLEPTSTNFLPYSNDFSQSNWVKQTNITATYNTTETLSPDGTYNATKLVGDGTDGIFDSSLSITGDVTRSVYLKSVSGTVTLKLKDSNINIGIETLTVTTEWQRFYLSGDNGSSLQGIFIFNIPSSGVYMWGAQVENSPYPTSYIPTLTGSTETRATETATGAGSADLINSTEGVLYAEIAALRQVNDNIQFLAINSSSYTQNSIYIQLRSSTNQIGVWAYSNGSNEVAEPITLTDITSFNKIAIRWKVNDFNIFINGASVFTDTSYNAPTSNSLNSLEFARGGSSNIYCKCKALAVFNEALSDSELTQLTT